MSTPGNKKNIPSIKKVNSTKSSLSEKNKKDDESSKNNDDISDKSSDKSSDISDESSDISDESSDISDVISESSEDNDSNNSTDSNESIEDDTNSTDESESSDDNRNKVKRSRTKKIEKPKVKSSPSQRKNKKKIITSLLSKSDVNAPGTINIDMKSKVPENTIVVIKTDKIPKPKIDPSTIFEERFLTKEEIEYIVDIIPMVPAAVAEIGFIIQQQIKNWLSIELMDLKIIPLGIEILRSQIEFDFFRSLAEPGKTIGVTCAESIGQPLTQITLSSFHQTGSSTAGASGVDSIREMLNISSERKNEFTTIHFRNKDLSYDEAFEMRRHLSSLTLHDVTKKSSFIKIEDKNISTRGWWYDSFFSCFKNEKNESDLEESNVYLRLYLDVQKMYDTHTTIKSVVEVIEGIDKNNKEEICCKCVYSPTSIGIIDIYAQNNVFEILKKNLVKVNKTALNALSGEGVEIIFLQRCIVNKMSEIIIKGIPGLREIFPTTVKTPLLFKFAQPFINEETNHGIGNFLSEEDKKNLFPKKNKNPSLNNIWKIWIDFIKVRVSGIPISKLVKLIEASGLEVLYSPPDIDNKIIKNKNINPLYNQLRHDCIVVKVNDEIINKVFIEYDEQGNIKEEKYMNSKKKKFNPVDYINSFATECNRLRDLYNKQVKENKKNIIPLEENVKKFLLHSGYVYVDVIGINMKSLILNSHIDISRCKCNNFNVMMETFDIEVTRNSYIREFYDHIVNNGAFMNLKYLTLISEFVTCQGFLIPVTSRGVSRQNIGPFSKASFEHAMATFIDAASNKKHENIKSTSTAIFVGQRALIGSGLCQPIVDEDMIKEINLKNKTDQKVDIENIETINLGSNFNYITPSLSNVDEGDSDLNKQFKIENDISVTNEPQAFRVINTSKKSTYPLCDKINVPELIITNLSLPEWVVSIIGNITNINQVKINNNKLIRAKIIKDTTSPIKKIHIDPSKIKFRDLDLEEEEVNVKPKQEKEIEVGKKVDIKSKNKESEEDEEVVVKPKIKTKKEKPVESDDEVVVNPKKDKKEKTIEDDQVNIQPKSKKEKTIEDDEVNIQPKSKKEKTIEDDQVNIQPKSKKEKTIEDDEVNIQPKSKKEKTIEDDQVNIQPKSKKEKTIEDDEVNIQPKSKSKKEKTIEDDEVNIKPKSKSKKEKTIEDDEEIVINPKKDKKGKAVEDDEVNIQPKSKSKKEKSVEPEEEVLVNPKKDKKGKSVEPEEEVLVNPKKDKKGKSVEPEEEVLVNPKKDKKGKSVEPEEEVVVNAKKDKKGKAVEPEEEVLVNSKKDKKGKAVEPEEEVVVNPKKDKKGKSVEPEEEVVVNPKKDKKGKPEEEEDKLILPESPKTKKNKVITTKIKK